MLYHKDMKGRDLVRLLEENGWTLDRITGSHRIMVKPGQRSVPVSFHGGKDLDQKYVKAILKQAGIE